MATVSAIWRRNQSRCYSKLATISPDFNWDSLGFHLVPTDNIYVMKCRKDENFSRGNIANFEDSQDSQWSPAAGILNYGQGLLEGLKAYRKADGSILLFRPEENARRMQMGAERLCMPSPSVDQFINAVKLTALSNRRWVPPPGKGSLYIRPLLLGSGPTLGVGPSSEYTFITYASPVSTYHKGPLNLFVEEKMRRAIPGGVGGVKAITNYAPIYKSIVEAKARGFSDVLFLDAVTGRYIEEASTSNIFLVKGNVISTPAINGTILPGITRNSIIQIALSLGFQVEERNVSVEELSFADEIFCTGTAAVVSPVHSITFQGNRFEYTTKGDSVSQELGTILTGIQQGDIEDKLGWTVEID